MKTVNPNLNRNVKKILSLLLLGCMLLPSFSSCHRKRVDPFKTTPSGEASESVESFKDEEDPFYSMTEAESVQKYGFSALVYQQTCFDGKKYIYEYDTFDTETFCRYPVGEPEKKTSVCSDPLCTHKWEDGCPFAGIFPLLYAFCGETLYYITKRRVSNAGDKITKYELCMYDPQNNKKIVVDSVEGGGDEYMFLRNMGGTLYYSKREEKKGTFDYHEVWYKLDENGNLTKFTTMEEHFGVFSRWVYDDRIFIFVSLVKDDGSTYAGDEECIERLGVYDVTTGEERLLHSFTNEGGSGVIYSVEYLNTYGNRALFSVSEQRRNSSGYVTVHRYYWLNLDTMEEELFFEEKGVNNRFYTDRCVMYCENREAKSDPLILHVYFPVEDTEEVYNLSEIVGEELRLGTEIYRPEKGAIKLTYFDSKGMNFTYEINLVAKTARYIGEESET